MPRFDFEKTRDFLVREYPNCFVPKNDRKKPLKIGIDRDLRNAVVGHHFAAIRFFIRQYTKGTGYYTACTIDGTRYDLMGKPHGEVTTTQKAYAQAKLEERLAAGKH